MIDVDELHEECHEAGHPSELVEKLPDGGGPVLRCGVCNKVLQILIAVPND